MIQPNPMSNLMNEDLSCVKAGLRASGKGSIADEYTIAHGIRLIVLRESSIAKIARIGHADRVNVEYVRATPSETALHVVLLPSARASIVEPVAEDNFKNWQSKLWIEYSRVRYPI